MTKRLSYFKALTIYLTFSVILVIVAGPTGCNDSAGPADGPTFPGNETGADGREPLFIVPEGYDVQNCSWSPAGDKLAFVFRDYITQGFSKLYIYNLNTGLYEEVPNTQYNPIFPRWSHNGEWILYYSSYDFGVYIIRPDGSDNTLIYGGGGNIGLNGSWSPDDREIVFCGNGDLTVADISDLDDIKYRVIGPRDSGMEEWDGTAYWSPRGEFIAIKKKAWFGYYGEDYIYITDPYGTFYEKIIPNQTNATISIKGWSPDGRYLLLKCADTLVELHAYDLKTGEFNQLTYGTLDRDTDVELNIEDADWANNGKIAFEVFHSDMYHNNPDGPWNIIYTIDAPY